MRRPWSQFASEIETISSPFPFFLCSGSFGALFRQFLDTIWHFLVLRYMLPKHTDTDQNREICLHKYRLNFWVFSKFSHFEGIGELLSRKHLIF